MDIAKFVCAILILIIHTNLFGSFSKILSFGFLKLAAKALLGTVLGYGLLCAEVLVYKVIGNTRGIDTVASLLPLTVCAFLFALSFDVAPSKLCMSLRKYSMLIFLCQRLPISVIDLFLSDTVLATNTLVNCATVTAATLLISFVILHLSEKVRWLKKIY